MKKILLFIIFTTSFLFALGEEIHDFKYETNYNIAHTKALKEDKILLIMMEKHGCPNCAYMKDIVFERENILNYINEHYIVLLLNVDRRNYPTRFISSRAPTFYFINPKTDNALREHKIGGSRPWKFIEELQAVKTAFDTNTTVDLNSTKKEEPLSSVIKIINETTNSTNLTP